MKVLAPNTKRRNPNGFEQRGVNKHEGKSLKPTVTENDVISANEQQHHNSPYLQTASDANVNKDKVNSKTLTYGSERKSKAHSKRARNRSLEMVIDDDKADSSPSRSRYTYNIPKMRNTRYNTLLEIIKKITLPNLNLKRTYGRNTTRSSNDFYSRSLERPKSRRADR